MVKLSAFALTAAALVGLVNADLKVTNPSSTLWWVAKSQNVLAWTCNESPVQNFTVLIGNKDPKVLVAPLAFIGVQNNFDCSKLVTQDQSNQPAGTGYTIYLANPLNNTQIYAQSEEFEIKALGSAYPSTTSSVQSATGTSGASSSTGTNKPNDASALGASAAFGIAALGAVLGLITA